MQATEAAPAPARAPNGVLPVTRQLSGRRVGGAAWRYVVLAVVSALYLFPFVVVLTTSFKPADEIFKLPPSLGSDRWTLDNYRAALDAMPFGRYLFNTALISSITVVGQLLSSSIVAYSLAKIRWRGRDALLLLIVATMMLPPQVTMIPVYIAWSKLGLTGTYLPLLIPQFFGLPFFIFMLRQFFRGIPEELIDAARVEGASDFRIYRSVVLPLSRPALVALSIFAFMWAWTDFLLPLIYINDPEQYTLSIGLYSFFSEHGVEWGALMAAATLMSLPLVLLFLVGQRQFVRGIALTGIK
ncbi:MAG: carbohydrate ABC transporter permease [Chloroflexi bacterium]|nr:MAG: carbohydrate ABC transporter permease [Chloroflexota bacterium]